MPPTWRRQKLPVLNGLAELRAVLDLARLCRIGTATHKSVCAQVPNRGALGEGSVNNHVPPLRDEGGSSPPDHLLQMLGIARAVHLDL